MSRVGTALAGLVLAIAGAAAARAAPPSSPEAVAAFAARDAEGRWVAYRATPEPLGAWVTFLAGRRDFELLEWIALTTRTLEALDALQTADAPGWIRCAFFKLTSADSHALDAARRFLLDRRPGAVLEWLDRFPAATHGVGAGVVRALHALQPPPSREDATTYLGPWDADVLLAVLVPPASLATLSDAAPTRPGVVYVHQVVRAIETWTISSLRAEPWTGRVAALVGHARPAVARAAALACAYLPATQVPAVRLAALVDDATRPPDVRSAAVLGLSFASGAEAYVRLCRVAAEPDHVAWSAAVSRLGDVGDELAVAVLAPLALGAPPDGVRDRAVASIRARFTVEEPDAMAARVPNLLARVAVAANVDASRAATYRAAAVAALRARLEVPAVRAAVAALRDAPIADGNVEAWRVAALARAVLDGASAEAGR